MSKWVHATLKDICRPERGSIISGPFGSNISSKFFVDEGVPVIRGNNLSLSLDKFYDDGFVYVTKEKADELNCYALEGDLLFTAAGTIGQVGILEAPLKYEKYVISNKQLRARVDTKKVDRLYAYYWFSSAWMQDYFIRNNKGSTVPLISLAELKDAPISYPEDISEQRRIVAVIEVLSRKIETNRSISSELEFMTKTIYDYWFTQFDFPDADGKPYRSSGGEMEWNEQFKREIPKGWIVAPLSQYLNCNKHSVRKKDQLESICYLDTGSLTDNAMDSMECYESISVAPVRAQRIVHRNDILYSTVRPIQRHYGIIKHPAKNMVASSGFACLSSKADSKYNDLFYLFITAPQNTKKLCAIADSSVSAYPSINPSDILDLQIALPKHFDEIDELVSSLSSLLYAKAHWQDEIRQLLSLRSWLLPMLMNGQATVTDTKEEPKVISFAPKSDNDHRFAAWLQNQGIAARGNVDMQTMREIFNAMDDDDK